MIAKLERNARAPSVQDLPALCSYLLLRGHAWADKTSVHDALELVGDGAQLGELGAALHRLLKHRARVDGPYYSVADVSRVAWHRRSVDTWARSFYTSGLIAWPGGQAWADLGVAHLCAAGWTTAEIARMVELPRRTIRNRADRISRSVRWAIMVPGAFYVHQGAPD